MELEQNIFLSVFLFRFYYIIPIWNWSPVKLAHIVFKSSYYIIPIWNWSWSKLTIIPSTTNNYIIPIWNWSTPFLTWFCLLMLLLHYSYMELELKFGIVFLSFVYITLFLYGIGACFSLDITSNSSGSLHYSYMELELS